MFVVYYRREESSETTSSSPSLAVKMDGRSKMEKELAMVRKLPTLDPATEKRFAKPIICEPIENDNEAVLIAPFRSVDEAGSNHVRREVRVNDLWKLLNCEKWLEGDNASNVEQGVGKHIDRALDLVAHLHLGKEGKYRRELLSYATALKWYLRDTCMFNGAVTQKSRAPANIFGDEAKVTAFGTEWTNPRHVIRKLLEPARTFEATTGAVHGDLHPKNIVLDKNGELYIIDFGWTCTSAPVVVDYILLDINLRSITLPSQFGCKDILDIASFMDMRQKPSNLHPFIETRINLIQEKIWRRLKTNVVQDWTLEYIIPFFMVAYGLLVHLDSARNQMALVATVLAAGEYIEGTLQD